MEAFKKVDNYMKDDTRLALLEQSIGHINETLIRMDKRFDNLEKRFDQIDNKFEIIDKRFDQLDAKIESERELAWSHFRWTIGAMLTLLGTIVAGIVKGHIT